jgi:hypothetical protein
LRASIGRVTGPAILSIAAACSLSTGCAFFENLNSSGYSQPEAGVVDAQCNADSGCLTIDCAHDTPDGEVRTCDLTQVCCLSVSPSGGLVGNCMNPSDCSRPSIPLCTNNDLCEGGGLCSQRFCALPGATFVVKTCEPIANCTTP